MDSTFLPSSVSSSILISSQFWKKEALKDFRYTELKSPGEEYNFEF